jgi:hypothetical protein
MTIPMRDSEGKEVEVPSTERVEEIRRYALATAAQSTCNDHPCEFGWADDCLTLLAKIDDLQKSTSE